MSEGVARLDRLRRLDEAVWGERQRLFEQAGGRGLVRPFVRQGASDEGWGRMSAQQRDLWLGVARVRTTPAQEREAMKGRTQQLLETS